MLQVLGPELLDEAEHESAYFFADELPAVGAWQFGPEEAATIPTPTLVISGTASRPWFGENAALLSDMLPAGEALSVDGWDHLAPLTHPTELAGMIADFVDSCVQTERAAGVSR
jgi:pimeloyl-ACP methyl ester carboxylesterase